MSEKFHCPYCNASFRSAAAAADHLKQHEKQPVSTMLTRKLADKMAKKRRTGFMIDTNRSGVFPEPATESVDERMAAIKQQVRELNEIRLKRLPIIVAAVRSALKSKRLKGKHRKFWMKKYSVTGGLAKL